MRTMRLLAGVALAGLVWGSARGAPPTPAGSPALELPEPPSSKMVGPGRIDPVPAQGLTPPPTAPAPLPQPVQATPYTSPLTPPAPPVQPAVVPPPAPPVRHAMTPPAAPTAAPEA